MTSRRGTRVFVTRPREEQSPLREHHHAVSQLCGHRLGHVEVGAYGDDEPVVEPFLKGAMAGVEPLESCGV